MAILPLGGLSADPRFERDTKVSYKEVNAMSDDLGVMPHQDPVLFGDETEDVSTAPRKSWWKLDLRPLRWWEIVLCTLVVQLILPPTMVQVSRWTKGRYGATIADGDSMHTSAPWGSLVFHLPIRPRDGWMVLAKTKDGLVVKRMSMDMFISENPNGKFYAPGQYEYVSTGLFVWYCPLLMPPTSGPAQISQGAAAQRKIFAEAAPVESQGGIYRAQYMPGNPLGQLWIKGHQLPGGPVRVEFEGKTYEGTAQFEAGTAPSQPGAKNGGVAQIRLKGELGGPSRDVTVKITPLKGAAVWPPPILL